MEPIGLKDLRVAVLRRPDSAQQPDEAYANAGVAVVDLPLPEGDADSVARLGRALASSCQAIVLDLEEEALGDLVAKDAKLPVLLASQAALIHNTARVLAVAATLDEPLAELRIATGGSAAQAVGELLAGLGVPAENLIPLTSGADQLPPRTDLLLVPDADRGRLPGSDQVQEVGLVRADGGVVLPALIRAAVDADVILDSDGCGAVADALSRLAEGGQLPAADDPRIVPVLAAAAKTAAGAEDDGYRDALAELRSPVRRAARPAIAAARETIRRMILVDGEQPAVIQAARALADEGLAVPILLGDLFRLEAKARQLGVSLKGIRVINPKRDKWRAPYAKALHQALGRELGLDAAAAERLVGEPLTFAALTVAQGEAHGLLVLHDRGELSPLAAVLPMLGRRDDVRSLPGAHVASTGDRTVVITDTVSAVDPNSEELAEAALQGAWLAEALLGSSPRVALLAHSSFGATRDRGLERIARARELVLNRVPELVIEGPLEADAALDAEVRTNAYGFCSLEQPANVLVAPSRGAASVALGALRRMAGAEVVGPFFWGLRQPAAVVSRDASAEDIVLHAVFAAAQAVHADDECDQEAPEAGLERALKRAVADAAAEAEAARIIAEAEAAEAAKAAAEADAKAKAEAKARAKAAADAQAAAEAQAAALAAAKAEAEAEAQASVSPEPKAKAPPAKKKKKKKKRKPLIRLVDESDDELEPTDGDS